MALTVPQTERDKKIVVVLQLEGAGLISRHEARNALADLIPWIEFDNISS